MSTAGSDSGRSGGAVDTDSALAEGHQLAAAGDVFGAIDLLTAANRRERDAAIERRLVELRHAAFAYLERDRTGSPWPSETPVRPDPQEGLPALVPSELTPQRVREGILRHGCVHVRGLVPPDRVSQLIDGIDRALAAYDASVADGVSATETTPWWDEFVAGEGGDVVGRKWVRDSGGVWTAESPRNLFDYLEIAEEVGLRTLVTEYLGERPALSLRKSTLRKVPLDSGGEWHQDGAFLGTGIRTLNVWLCLTDCGTDAPGMEILPRRLDHIVETGAFGTWFEWAVAPPQVEEARGGVELIRPDFKAGDVMFFDELFLHRTFLTSAMTRERYAIENWFFAPSTYPDDQIPIVW